jgi:hypothetical protein
MKSYTLDDQWVQFPLANRKDIRLLKIDTVSENSNEICYNIIVANLDQHDLPHFIALSYTWGAATHEQQANGITTERTHTITWNGAQICVTKNLYDFLHRAGSSDSLKLKSTYLWIDMLCVNQSNLDERMEQVKLMSTIYSSADSVLVWLGEEDPNTKIGFEIVKHISTLDLEDLKKTTPAQIGIDDWTSVRELFQRTWFTRVWIIQEVILAKTILVLCGSYSIKWEDIVKTSYRLTLTAWSRNIRHDQTNTESKKILPQSSYAIPNVLRAQKETMIEGHEQLLLYSLIRSRRFQASDPRDKVYALLGICGDNIKAKPYFNPVYENRSTEKSYTLAAIQILKDSDDLLLLAHAEGDKFRSFKNLPSWVPDWSVDKILGLGVTGYLRFSAAKDLQKYLSIDEESLRLTLQGFRLDDIMAIGESKRQVLSGESFPRWLSLIEQMNIIYFTNENRAEVFWRTLITNTAGPPEIHPAPRVYGKAFNSWISSKLELLGESPNRLEIFQDARALISPNPPTDLAKSTEIQNDRHQSDPKIVSADEIALVVEDFETTFSYSPHVSPFLTRSNYMGIGSESLQINDSIWVVAGSRVPLILRPSNDSTYKIVGAAYVHGFMHGEAVKPDVRLQNIILS